VRTLESSQLKRHTELYKHTLPLVGDRLHCVLLGAHSFDGPDISRTWHRCPCASEDDHALPLILLAQLVASLNEREARSCASLASIYSPPYALLTMYYLPFTLAQPRWSLMSRVHRMRAQCCLCNVQPRLQMGEDGAYRTAHCDSISRRLLIGIPTQFGHGVRSWRPGTNCGGGFGTEDHVLGVPNRNN
jgi:hypothetical protein